MFISVSIYRNYLTEWSEGLLLSSILFTETQTGGGRRGPCPVRVRLEFILSGKTSGSSG